MALSVEGEMASRSQMPKLKVRLSRGQPGWKSVI